MILKDMFRPDRNRYYLGKKRHLKQYILFRFVFPVLFFAVLILLMSDQIGLLLIALVVVFILNIISYFTDDKLTDRLTWKLLGKYYTPKEDKHYDATADNEKGPADKSSNKT